MLMKPGAVVGITLSLLCTAASAVNKCTLSNGAVVYQDAPCVSGKKETLDLRPSSAWGSSPVAPAHPAEDTDRAEPAPAPATAPPVAAKSQLEVEANACLSWYLPLLLDPLRTYYTNPRKDKRVLSIDIHTTNRYGGISVKTASCEIDAGRLNETWTKTHAKRGGWILD